MSHFASNNHAVFLFQVSAQHSPVKRNASRSRLDGRRCSKRVRLMSNSPIVDRTASATAAFTGRIGGLMSAFGPITEVATLAISDAAARTHPQNCAGVTQNGAWLGRYIPLRKAAV